MNLLAREALTIGSTITPPGIGGVSVIRVSGPDALSVVSKLAGFLPENPESHKVYYGFLREMNSDDKIDEVLISYFAKGKSFTGEESLEISHHGSPTLSKQILNALCHAGMHLARPGEFTFRAFLNQRIDLVQAEAVLDLIESKSQRAAKVALQQLEGKFSHQLHEYEHVLLGVLAHLEANLDFAQEDIVVEERENIKNSLIQLKQQFEKLMAYGKASQSLRESFRVALVGNPNVGKSSLLNALCEKDLAIVSEIPGTTRDVVVGDISVDGNLVHIYDTAGLRETDDQIEKLGMQKTSEKMRQSDLVFHVLEATNVPAKESLGEYGQLIVNKVDTLDEMTLNQLKLNYPEALFVSAVKAQNIDSIHNFIASKISQLSIDESPALLQARHLEAIETIIASLQSGIEQIEDNASDEFVIFEVQNALMALFEILGKRFDDEILDRVFKEFCLGK